MAFGAVMRKCRKSLDAALQMPVRGSWQRRGRGGSCVRARVCVWTGCNLKLSLRLPVLLSSMPVLLSIVLVSISQASNY